MHRLVGAHSVCLTCHVSWAPHIVEGRMVNVPPSAFWSSPVVGLPHAKQKEQERKHQQEERFMEISQYHKGG
jgi:hypothetical protein